MYITRDLSKADPLRGMRAAKKPAAPVKLNGRPAAKPVRVVKLYDPKKKAADAESIRRLERAGLTEGNSKSVALMKANYRRRYGERI
ncbi:MAG: hypothetical protein E5V62_02990 [Mesorhizobium sp.]|uniref:hypothetical protein n=1 Tax=Mesorhizobium sp. TaxID=1871066 RepID=UPI000FD2F75D|nr:hypothetical protein [Mesorhizobium sp.]RVD72930.1 hypothetical protein EN751_07545 [Mesorhizobium sp. M4A.F.Ca.ET.029.04.2.1]TIW37131.1 MAG: hypothetical protein E5V62_02990 [Mesorhizobium sp.]